MPRITIPASIEEATSNLNGLGSLLQAKEWQRAAIVYAFTERGAPGPKGDRPDTGAISIREFARLGIVGLSKQDTVAEYRKAWESAMADGAPDVKPGDTISIPNLPWPPGIIDHRRGRHATTDEIVEGVREKIEADPIAAIAEIMQDHPTLAHKVAEGVLANPMTKVAIEVAQAGAVQPRMIPSALPLPPRDYRALIVRGVGDIIEAIRAEERGDYAMSGSEDMLLGLVGAMLTQRQTATVQPNLFDQIDAYLKGTVAP